LWVRTQPAAALEDDCCFEVLAVAESAGAALD